MALDPITAVVNLIDKGLDKFVMDKGQKEKLASKMQVFVAQESTKADGIFRDFIIKYEGAAKDVPKLIVYLRALIRPFFTIATGYFDWIYFTGDMAGWNADAVGLLKAINVIVLIFWFGEKAVTNSGIIDKLIKK